MFVSFDIANYRSFRDLQHFSMQAAPIRSNEGELEEGHVFTASSLRLLKSKAIFGANASGKSNLAKAMATFSTMVSQSVAKEGLARTIWEDRFKLMTDWEDQPIFFQFTFTYNNAVYRYGFQILKDIIAFEWLFGVHQETEIQYFMRSGDQVNVDSHYLSGSDMFTQEAMKGNNELFRSDALFLTAGALNGNRLLHGLREDIRSIMAIDGAYDSSATQYALQKLIQNPKERKKQIAQLLMAADTGVEDLELGELPDYLVAPDLKEFTEKASNKALSLYSYHSRYDEEGRHKDRIAVPFGEWESAGTGKLFGIGSLILDALAQGRTIVIDELDAGLHPNLTLKIVQLFNDEKSNPLHAQLIFVTHDASLLKRAELRRDQICLINKDQYGMSTVTTLIQFRGVRKDASYEKEYLNGTYTGVPFLGKMGSIASQKTKS